MGAGQGAGDPRRGGRRGRAGHPPTSRPRSSGRGPPSAGPPSRLPTTWPTRRPTSTTRRCWPTAGPIATGVIGGACRHLVKDRMDVTGARWGLAGAEAVLTLRALVSNGDFDTCWHYHILRERATHPRRPLRRQHHPASGMTHCSGAAPKSDCPLDVFKVQGSCRVPTPFVSAVAMGPMVTE